ncbi:MAG: sugar phosphate nucleotidyltransferase [Acidimicrobiales bacterium]
MRAVVLVGGLGTRLRPLTLRTPKQMLPVAGRPMIERVVAHLAEHGVDEVVLSLGFKPDAFTGAYPDATCAGVRLVYAVEPEPLGTAGAIRFAANEAGVDERFLVVNGDVLTDLDVSALVSFHDQAHERAGAEATIALVAVDDPSSFGVVTTDGEGRVAAFVEKPAPGDVGSNSINAGYYVLEPHALERIPAGERVSIERETFPAMVAEGVVWAPSQEAWWIDVGTPERYLQASLDLIDRQPGEANAISRNAISDIALVASNAVVTRSAVGPGARIGRGAKVEDSVVFSRAIVGNGAVVKGSILGASVVVGAGAVVRDLSVLGNDVEIDDGAELVGATLPDPQTWP